MQPGAVASGLLRLLGNVVGIGVTTGTLAIVKAVCTLVDLVAASAGLPVAVLVILPGTDAGVGTQRAADAHAVLKLVGAVVDQFTANAVLPVVALIVVPFAHIGMIAGTAADGAVTIDELVLATVQSLAAIGAVTPVDGRSMLPLAHIGVGAGSLVVGIGIAADADAFHKFMLALLELLAALAGLPVTVLVILPGTQLGVVAIGFGLLRLLRLLGIGGLIGLEDTSQFCIGVQTGDAHCAFDQAQLLQLIVGQVEAVEHSAVNSVDAQVGAVLADTGEGSAGGGSHSQLTNLGNAGAGIQLHSAVVHIAGQLQLVQITGLIQDQEVIVVALAVVAQLGAHIQHSRQLHVLEGAGAGVDLGLSAGLGVLLHVEQHGLAGGILAVGGMQEVAAQCRVVSSAGGSVDNGDGSRGNTGKVNGGVICKGGIALCVDIDLITLGGIQFLIGVGGITILGHTEDSVQLTIPGTGCGPGVVVGIVVHNLIGHVSGVDLCPGIAGSGLDIAVDVLSFHRLGGAGDIGFLGDLDIQAIGQAQTHQVGSALQNAHLAQLSLHHIVAPQFGALGSGLADDDAVEGLGLHADHGNIFAVLKLQTGLEIVNFPAGIVGQQLAVL